MIIKILIFFMLSILWPNLASANLRDGLVGWWKFDEASGNAIDSSGNGYTGTLVGTVLVSQCKSSGCRDFDGVDDDVEVGTTATILGVSPTQPFSVSLWAKADVWTTLRAGLITSYSDGSAGWDLRIEETLGTKGAYFTVGAWNANIAAFASASINKAIWNHYVGVFDGSNISVYVNAVIGGTTNTGSITSTAHPVRIGSDYNRDPGRFFDGKIDDVRIYNRALSTQDINDLYNSGVVIRNAVIGGARINQ